MFVVVSPAKRLRRLPVGLEASLLTEPALRAHTDRLAARMKELPRLQIQRLMHLSEALTDTTQQAYQAYGTPEAHHEHYPAFYYFAGDVYRELDAPSLETPSILWAQQRVRILSGFYGLLRPLDRIEPHRLPMGSPLAVEDHPDLYAFWKKPVEQELVETLRATQASYLIVLASQEYARVMRPEYLPCPVVNVQFKERRQGTWKTIGVTAKRARGALLRYILEQTPDRLEALKDFQWQGYRYHAHEAPGSPGPPGEAPGHFLFLKKQADETPDEASA